MPTSVPGAGRYRFVATRDESGSYAMVYVPIGRKFKVRMDKITGPAVQAWWFNPRNGKATAIGAFPNTGEREFLSPNPGENLDWVLVLPEVLTGHEPGRDAFHRVPISSGQVRDAVECVPTGLNQGPDGFDLRAPAEDVG